MKQAAVSCALLFFLATRANAVEVIVPERNNLQYLAFWVALGSGALDELAVTLRVPDSPGETGKLFAHDAAQVAVLPPPLFFQIVADGTPLRVVANLLANDPIDLIVRRSFAAAHKIDRSLPLRERLTRMRGMRLGIAPGPPPRLRALFQSVGLEPTVESVTLMGQEQNQAFADGKVDALYTHTPFLERALAQGDCVVMVDQAGGEVPSLAGRQIHTLVASERMLREQRPVVDKLVAAIARAERLIHQDRPAALNALLKAVPGDRALTSRLLDLYAGAVPLTPAVSAGELTRALSLYPGSKRPPDLSHVDFSTLVFTPTRPRP